MHQLADRTKQNKQNKKNKTHPGPPNIQLLGSSNSSAESMGGCILRSEGSSQGVKSKPGLGKQQLGGPSKGCLH